MAATALTAGSLGGLVALWREKTFPALALTTLFLVLYLCLVQAVEKVPFLVDWLSGRDNSEPGRGLGILADVVGSFPGPQ